MLCCLSRSLICIYYCQCGLELERADISFIQMVLEKSLHICHTLTQHLDGMFICIHLGYLGSEGLLGGCRVAAGECRWSSEQRERSVGFRLYRWYLGPGRAKLELDDDSSASSCMQLRITFSFPYGHLQFTRLLCV